VRLVHERGQQHPPLVVWPRVEVVAPDDDADKEEEDGDAGGDGEQEDEDEAVLRGGGRSGKGGG
jgi:hypothetical protein